MWIWLVSGGLLVFAAAFVVGGLLQSRDGRRLLAEGVPVRGRVIAIFDDHVNEHVGVRVEYHLDGRRYVVEPLAWKKDLAIGEEVELRCLRSAPSDARRYRPNMGAAEMTGFFVGAGIASLIAVILASLRLGGVL